VQRLRGKDVLGWAAIGLAGASLVVACLLPAFVIAIEAFVGAGAAQRSFRYERELTIAGDLRPSGLVLLCAGVAVVALAVVGCVRGSRPALVVASFVIAAALTVLVFDTFDRRLDWPGNRGVIGYEDNSGGPLLGRALSDLRADARRSPEAQNAGWTLSSGEDGYAARGLVGWRLFAWSTLAVLWLTAFRLARLRFRPLSSALLVAAASLVLLAWLFLRALSNMD
jgi:hypothetical protein